MTVTPDQKEGHWHRERSREMEAVLFVQSLPPSGDGCSHLGILWAEISEVCVLVFTSIPVLIIYMGLWERERNSAYLSCIRGEAGGPQQIP